MDVPGKKERQKERQKDNMMEKQKDNVMRIVKAKKKRNAENY